MKRTSARCSLTSHLLTFLSADYWGGLIFCLYAFVVHRPSSIVRPLALSLSSLLFSNSCSQPFALCLNIFLLILFDFSTYLCFWGNIITGAGGDTVDVTKPPSLTDTRFTECFIQKNALDPGGFKEWAFCPGMLFHSTDKWWGDHKKRDKPHEGLDLCLYKDRKDMIVRLGETAKIPAICDGMVAGILDDFLGKSIIVESLFSGCDRNRLCTIYGHIIPKDHLHVGSFVEQGDVIAALADSRRFKTNIFPHLHISLGWASKTLSYDRLDWKNIGDPNTLTLLDPLQIIDWHYVIMGRETCENF